MSVEKIFEELKRDGHIHKKRRLKTGSSFRAGIFSGRIIYPEGALKKEQLSDDTLRFILLHEEGHLSRFKAPKFIIRILVAYSIFWIIYKIFLPELNLIPGSILYIFNPLTIFILLVILFITVFKKYELKCDRWAAEVLKKEYDIEKPTVLLEELYSWWEWVSGKKDLKHVKKQISPTPSLEKRIENIEEVCDGATE